MPNLDIFTGGGLTDQEIDEILTRAQRNTRQSVSDNHEYLVHRRQILGRAADVTHPAFGDPNSPEENFKISYEINARDTGSLTEIVVREFVYDHKGVLVYKQKL